MDGISPKMEGSKAVLRTAYINQKVEDKGPKKKLQLEDRIYPDIYECGPACHTGSILKTLNYKAYRNYKHICA